ncbi:MAG: hypothetical protein OXB84_02730, partial [Halobacteriovoraceae bacterium]|nr:hypothetical protein [Halobacteriovoraceae bacterium]
KQNLEIIGDIKLFYTLPNSLAMRIYGIQSLESDGNIITNNDNRINRIDSKRLALFKYWSLSHIHYPKHWWSWGIRFSPSLSFFNWSSPGKVTLAHILYDAKGVLNLPNALGSIFASAGMGPIYANGSIYSAKENKKITFAPRFQLGYYRFINKKTFFQIKYKKYYLRQEIFNGNGFSINNVDIMGFYIGYYFPNI